MNPWIVCSLALATCLLASVAFAEAPRRILWEKVPIALQLRTGTERIVHFPHPVSLGVPQSHRHMLRAQSLDGTVYLNAHEAFDAVRLQVRGVDTGSIYLLDVSAGDHAPPGRTVQVELPPVSTQRGESTEGPRPFGYVTLTRFAAKKLYAPKRLAGDVPGIVRVAVNREPRALVRGGDIEARALASWRAGSLYVTAVQLTNRSALAHTLDARALRGEWLTATFQHHRLHGAGEEADTTVVYLISSYPFDEAAPAP